MRASEKFIGPVYPASLTGLALWLHEKAGTSRTCAYFLFARALRRHSFLMGNSLCGPYSLRIFNKFNRQKNLIVSYENYKAKTAGLTECVDASLNRRFRTIVAAIPADAAYSILSCGWTE